MFLSALYHNANSAETKAFGAAPHHWLRAPMLIVGIAIGAYELQLALESPGRAIRHDLMRAGSEIADLPWSTPKERVQETVLRHFPGYEATADATGFPVYVTVTLRDLDRDACRDAYQTAGRIEGRTVIAMERRDDRTCQDHASLTWRMMP
jgi:hypothetical protein